MTATPTDIQAVKDAPMFRHLVELVRRDAADDDNGGLDRETENEPAA